MKSFAYSLSFPHPALQQCICRQIMNFELSDGSIIHGRLISFSNGDTIQSDSLGTVKISETK
jgi:hypothetical protein